MDRPRLLVANSGQLDVQLVDQHSEATCQQERQFKAVTVTGHHPILMASCKIDNLVYDKDYLVVYPEGAQRHANQPSSLD
jgi:hypothetical protein